MCQRYNWQLQLHYHHVWWVALHLKCATRFLLCPKKHFKIGSCSKLHIHLKRELFQGYQKSFQHQARALCRSLRSVLLSSIINTGQNDSITRSLLRSNVVQVPLIVSARNCAVIVQWKQPPQHRSPFGILVHCYRENPSYSSTITGYFSDWKNCSAQTWLPKLLLKWCHHLIHCLTYAILTHPNTCYQTPLNGLTAHNCNSHIYTTHY
jgi:hypothetical protein